MGTRVGCIVAACALAAACSGGAQQEATSTVAANTTVATPTSSTSMTVVAVASHRFDYSDGPIVVFQPLPPLSDPTLSFAAGSVDYFDQQNDHPLRAPLLDSRVC